MYLSIHLNRNKTNELFPLFEAIFCIELLFILSTTVVGGLVIFAMCKTTIFHKTIRLRIVFGVLNAVIYELSRVIVLYHQYYGVPYYEESWFLIITAIEKQIFMSYMIILISTLAFDRWVATKYWAWYDTSHTATFAFFLTQEIAVHIIAGVEAFLLTYDYVPDIVTLVFHSFLTVIGTIGYTSIYRYNLKILEKLRIKAETSTYSVSRTCQIKENIALLRLFNKVALPLVFSTIPAFLFFFLFRFIPSGSGFDHFRFICIAMFDLWLSMSCLAVISCIPLHERKIVRYLLGQSIDNVKKRSSSQFDELDSATLAHFEMLSKEWL